MRKTFQSCRFLINPIRDPGRVSVLKRLLHESGFTGHIVSKNREHFLQVIRDFYRSNERILLIWGGDGSVHDAINIFIQTKEQKHGALKKSIGFLRGGSGNGYHDSYEVPRRLKDQIDAFSRSIRQDFYRDVDLLKVGWDRRVSYGQLVGFGFDVRALKRREERTLTGRKTGQVRSRLLNYLIPALSAFIWDFEKTQNDFSLVLSEGVFLSNDPSGKGASAFKELKREARIPMLEIGKRPYYGNRFRVCPGVICNNGYMDVYLYHFSRRTAVLKNIYPLWRGDHVRINKKSNKKHEPSIERYSVKGMRLITEHPLDFHIDGELQSVREGKVGNQIYRVSVLPGAISFVLPPSFYMKLHRNC
jgi:diacylglycerol kinase family enzyme